MDWIGWRIVMRFDGAEAQVLRSLATGVQELVGEGDPGADPLEVLVGLGRGTQAPRDPALARLLPDGYTDDAEAAGEFRRLTETSLRQHKRETAQRMLDSLPADGGQVCLDAETTRAWLSALNDIRLVIGTRLDLSEEIDGTEELLDGIEELDDTEEPDDTEDDTEEPDDTEDDTEEPDDTEPGDPRAPGYKLYRWLTLLQELLVDATLGEPGPD